MSIRQDGRGLHDLREVRITSGYNPHAEGSVLIEWGRTHVICTVSIEAQVPSFLKGQNKGWLTAEYGMLPRSTHTRRSRKTDGRMQEIQRLIGRALRTVVRLDCLGERTLTVDCDVISADGGTRTASITGAWVALHQALSSRLTDFKHPTSGTIQSVSDILQPLAAVSVAIGKAGNEPLSILLDPDYGEDSSATADINIVASSGERIIEIQGTAEKTPFSRGELSDIIDVGLGGIKRLMTIQQKSLHPLS